MHHYVFASWAPVSAGLTVAIAGYGVRHFYLNRPKTVNFFTIFMDASAAYVLASMIINHYVFDVSYGEMLTYNYGEEPTALAFLYASYHMIREIKFRIIKAT